MSDSLHLKCSECVLPSHVSPVWTERHRRRQSPSLSGWAFPRCSRARRAAPQGQDGPAKVLEIVALGDPLAVHPGGRMPSLALTDDESRSSADAPRLSSGTESLVARWGSISSAWVSCTKTTAIHIRFPCQPQCSGCNTRRDTCNSFRAKTQALASVQRC